MCKITNFPACAFYRVKPDPSERTICSCLAVQNASGATGALVRNNRTGIYQIYSVGCFSGIDHFFAKSIDKEGKEDVHEN